jgi:hypothetical protein
MDEHEPIVSELRAAGASLVLAIAAAENGEWAAAEQGVIDAQQRAPIILQAIQSKMAEPPSAAEELDDS